MDDQERLAQRADTLETRGKNRFGADTWSDMMGSLGRNGMAPAVQNLVASNLPIDSALDNLERASRESLLQEMSLDPWEPGARDRIKRAEAAYGDLRRGDRDFHAQSRGRRSSSESK